MLQDNYSISLGTDEAVSQLTRVKRTLGFTLVRPLDQCAADLTTFMAGEYRLIAL